MVELLTAMTIVLLLAGAVGSLALTVDTGSRYSEGRAQVAQHARVAIGRIQHSLNTAHTSAEFPGFAVFRRPVDAWVVPDTLVVWQPATLPADEDGLPLWSELVVFCPDVGDPRHLLELTDRDDHRVVPPLTDLASWQMELDSWKVADSTRRVVLTNMLRTVSTSNGAPGGELVGAARFQFAVRPSFSQWQAYQASTLGWEELDWVQGICGEQTGLRQARCAFELQMVPLSDRERMVRAEPNAIPFLGAGACYFELTK